MSGCNRERGLLRLGHLSASATSEISAVGQNLSQKCVSSCPSGPPCRPDRQSASIRSVAIRYRGRSAAGDCAHPVLTGADGGIVFVTIRVPCGISRPCPVMLSQTLVMTSATSWPGLSEVAPSTRRPGIGVPSITCQRLRSMNGPGQVLVHAERIALVSRKACLPVCPSGSMPPVE